jgi:ubiquinone/menaquinone biosynthesis C-methylase UbiE
MEKIPDHGVGKYIKVQSALVLLNCLENISTSMNDDPFSHLYNILSNQFSFLKQAAELEGILDKTDKTRCDANQNDLQEQSIELFQDAWTIYDLETYEHSVELIRRRLKANGFDNAYFSDKVCFDGGCGTGRFSIAMAEMGARHVVAADLGEESLEMAKKMANQYQLDNIEFVKQDITDLRQWNDDYFDFVASNGVLHHTLEAERGIREHYRITKKGGIFWLYLYGDGGIYWLVYDQLKMVLHHFREKEVKRMLNQFNVRQGLAYTFLDNVMAPIRKYYFTSNVIEMIKAIGDFDYADLKGTSEIDDTGILVKTRYGKEIYGPEGEVRIQIKKIC